MKRPPSLAYITLVIAMFTSLVLAQTKQLTILSSPLYVVHEKSIMETTDASENHKILVSALKATDLEDVLGESGPFTFFAPDDSAFARFSKEEMKSLFEEENKHRLKSLLMYHLVAGNISASKILKALCQGAGRATFTTLQGTKIGATIKGSDIILTDAFGHAAKITTADVAQSNGVIHEIDSVILPRGL